MGPTKIFPLFTNTASTTLTAWLCAEIEQPLPQQVAQGWQHFDQGDINAAIACFQDILDRSKAIGDAYFKHIADNSLQFIKQALSDWDMTWEEDSSQDAAPDQPDLTLPEHEHLSAAEAALQKNHFDEALKHLDQALQHFTTEGDIAGVGQSLTAIAGVYLTSTDYGRALTYGQAAIAVLEDCETPRHLAQALHTLGSAHFHLGHLDAAQTHLEKAATLYHSLDALAEGRTLSTLGQVYAQQKAFMFALAAYEAALDCCLEQTATATQALTAEILDHTGELYEAMGYDEFAIAPYQDALAAYQQTGNTTKANRLLHRLGHLYETQGRYTTALDCYRQLQQKAN